MSDKETFACIVCPRGCTIVVEKDQGAPEGFLVSGYACEKGLVYAKQEISSPMRTLTSTVRTVRARYPRLPVRTNGEIPLSRIPEAMKAIDAAEIAAPVTCGDIVIKDVLGTGVDIIATDSAEEA